MGLGNIKLQISVVEENPGEKIAEVLSILAAQVQRGEIDVSKRRLEGTIYDANHEPCGRWIT